LNDIFSVGAIAGCLGVIVFGVCTGDGLVIVAGLGGLYIFAKAQSMSGPKGP